MSQLRKIAQKIRHLPGLKRLEGFWSLVRKPYHRFLNASGYGVEVVVGNSAPVRIPAEYAGTDFDKYEPETVKCFSQWIRQHPDTLVLDIGSSLGIFSVVALFASERCCAVAFDPDLASIAATRRMCQHARGDRLRCVHGFLADKPTRAGQLAEAVSATEERLAKSKLTGDVGMTRYVCLTEKENQGVPTYSLDALLIGTDNAAGSLLIKCDVEGAELLVLQGARRLLKEHRPHLLFSIHPKALPDYGHSKQAVEEFLKQQGYRIQILDIDHEEHWWCKPN